MKILILLMISCILSQDDFQTDFQLNNIREDFYQGFQLRTGIGFEEEDILINFLPDFQYNKTLYPSTVNYKWGIDCIDPKFKSCEIIE